jgi:Conjugative transposon protein TcpC
MRGPGTPGLQEADPLLDPAPPRVPVAPRLLRLAARVLLWSLVGVGVLRGVLPAPAPPVAPPVSLDGRAAAVAAAFLREYLTAGDGLADWRSRLRPFVAPGVDLGDAPRPGSGSSRYADQVVAAGARSVDGASEVTVLAHVVEVRDGHYQDGRMVAYVVPVRTSATRVAVTGPPRSTTLPFEPGGARHEQPALLRDPLFEPAASSRWAARMDGEVA